jgi:hypothetical protein
MINTVFDLCVTFLIWLAPFFDMTYKEINVWVFCIIWPIENLIVLVALILVLSRKKSLNLDRGVTQKL